MNKTVVVYNPIRFQGEAWLPVLWAQAKTYYERNGQNQWNWAPCYADLYGQDIEATKQILSKVNPDVFAISLYVWNYQIAHQIAKWVKEQWPECLIITGGPHQYFKHNDQWFREHPYIDASLPGECYGELAFQELLDNINKDNRVDWNSISEVCYPQGQSRLPTYSTKKHTIKDKKNFDYNWSAMQAQSNHMQDFIDYAKSNFKNSKVLSIFETTRGCPYGCTYCDWGGGINTKVLQKPMDAVRQDIEAICNLNLNYVYFADANFGIFGHRDIEIIKYLAYQRKLNLQRFTVGYGGFAKTENKLDAIREILRVDIKNNLSSLGEIKLSLQTLDDEVLKRIDRKNVPLDKQIDVLQSLSNIKRLPLYVELIHGLPGMTVDKFYHEFDVLGSQRLSIQWYPWILLPEAPAYSRQYRDKEKLLSVIKTSGWHWKENNNNFNEIVVGTSTYTTDEYLEMVLATGFYRLFVQGGYLKETVKWLEQHNVNIGDLTKEIFKNFLSNSAWLTQAQEVWNQRVLKESDYCCFININGQEIYLGLYFIALAFLEHNTFTVSLAKWLADRYGCPNKIINRDLAHAIHASNFNTSKWNGPVRVDCRKKGFPKETDLNNILYQFIQFKNSGHLLRSTHKLLGLF